jgi:F-box and leucine-rich repeat protein 10/11
VKTGDADQDTILVGQAQSALAEAFDQPEVDDDDFNALIDPSLRPAIQQLQAATNAMTQSAHDMKTASASELDTNADQPSGPGQVLNHPNLTIHMDPRLYDAPNPIKQEPQPAALPTSSSQISATSLVSPPDSLHHDDDFSATTDQHDLAQQRKSQSIELRDHDANSSGDLAASLSNPLQTPKSAASRHSSRQPKPVDRYVPDAGNDKANGESGGRQPDVQLDPSANASAQSTGTEIKKGNHRDSSSRTSPMSASMPRVNNTSGQVKATGGSTHSVATSPSTATARRGQATATVSSSLSPPLATSPEPQQQQPKAGSRGRHSFGELEIEADEESLKLIRAIQEEEFGLRRRTSMRA